MKNLSTQLVLFFISFTLILSCKKDGLTKATQNGANTFSCKINGKVFQPCKDEGLFGSPSLWGGVNISAMAIASINAKCNNNFPKKTISVEFSNFNGEGEYLLSDSNISAHILNTFQSYLWYIHIKHYTQLQVR